MLADRRCIACGKDAPLTETNYTLISAKYGWRLTKNRLPDGTISMEWRCPVCWQEYKQAKSSISPRR